MKSFKQPRPANRAAADANVLGWQAQAKPGDKFIRMAAGGAIVFGEVLETPVEEDEDEDLTLDELAEEDKRKDAPPVVNHYRFSKCYSHCCPKGELGDIHVSTIAKIISEAGFEAARNEGWPTHPQTLVRISRI